MIDEGKILSRHEVRKENSMLTIFSIIFILAFSLVIIILAVTTPLFSTPSVLSILCVAIAAITLSSLLYLRLHSNPMFTYFLYEKGVRVFNHHNGKVYFIPFNKIRYIHKYHLGINSDGKINAMAFRTSKAQPWNIIINNIKNAYPLMNTLIHQQVINVGVISLDSLSKGEPILFEVIKRNDNWLVKLMLHSVINIIKDSTLAIETSPISLSAHCLATSEGIINMEDILYIETQRETYHDKIQLFDAKGKILFTIDYSALVSADLFIALVEHMIQNRIPAYHAD
ncbi:hypothetical protein [Yersinia aldovae]|uniref:Inner membrane protein n=1 Tax=Yersinia aldovae TaxID=29483 RepID=A0ABP1YMZ1_YERAL|nr:hypothetical protein [Yersinia aldovae]CNJ29225.1 Uncharacterised protein [Yersinia aldovae]CNK48126.1 Uncharacterised protein [Yersinia aldovae]